MCTRPSPRGFTLIELVVFIVIVSVGLVGVLSVFTTVTRNSADPLREKQALAAAESLLEEILHKPFCDPDYVTLATQGSSSPSSCGTTPDKEASRKLFDDVDDYDGYVSVGIEDLDSSGTVIPGYNMSVSVQAPSDKLSVTNAADVPAANLRIVTVTVADTVTHRSYSLTGYAFNND